MSPPTVIAERAGVVAILKPPGLATQAPPGIPSVEAWLRERLYVGDPRGYVGVPHRLDRAVSGVLLMAATPRAARKLSRQFERRQVAKTYLAVVAGGEPSAALPADETVEWRDLLEKIPDEARSRIATAATTGAREAVTRVCAMPMTDGVGTDRLLRLEPHTGRMHQLRLQAASRGMPIVGDVLYGGRPLSFDAVDTTDLILLHAWRIAYDDPDSGERLTIEAPMPAYWPA